MTIVMNITTMIITLFTMLAMLTILFYHHVLLLWFFNLYDSYSCCCSKLCARVQRPHTFAQIKLWRREFWHFRWKWSSPLERLHKKKARTTQKQKQTQDITSLSSCPVQKILEMATFKVYPWVLASKQNPRNLHSALLYRPTCPARWQANAAHCI